jgi:HSP20 family protein
MLPRRSNELHPISRLRTEMDRLFDGFFGEGSVVDPFPWHQRRAFPALNFWEDEHNLYAEAEVPGLKMEDLEVYVLGNELTISGKRTAVEQPEVAYHRRERGVGPFTRTLRLPVDIDADKVNARLQDGVLTVMLPKAEAAKPRKVEVKALGN